METPFDQYQQWLSSGNKNDLARLNHRWGVIINRNIDLLEDKTVLDIASHDGRWSWAALNAGAKEVIGIEARQDLVLQAKVHFENFPEYKHKCDFRIGDIHKVIHELPDNQFDTIMLNGFLYHSPHHAYLLDHISRITRHALIIDTAVVNSDSPLCLYREEKTEGPGVKSFSMAYTPDGSQAIVATPSREFLQLLLGHYGFQYTYCDQSINSWHSIKDYADGLRVTIRAELL